MTGFQVNPSNLIDGATQIDASTSDWQSIRQELQALQSEYRYFNDVLLILNTDMEYQETWLFHDLAAFGAQMAIGYLADSLRAAASNYHNADGTGASTFNGQVPRPPSTQ